MAWVVEGKGKSIFLGRRLGWMKNPRGFRMDAYCRDVIRVLHFAVPDKLSRSASFCQRLGASWGSGQRIFLTGIELSVLDFGRIATCFLTRW